MNPFLEKTLIWLKQNPNASLSSMQEIGEQLTQEILKSSYKLTTKKWIFSLIRKELPMGTPLKEYLKLPPAFLDILKKEAKEKVYKKINHKILISLPEHIALCKTLLKHKKYELLTLGLALATGRRYCELSLNNFHISKNHSNQLLFTGQRKKREPTKPYLIPLLVSPDLVKQALQRLSPVDLQKKAFYQRVTRHSHWLFGHKIHDLRAKYCSLILAREGLLEKDSLIEPLLRAQEILGHEEGSDSTLAYRQYAISDQTNQERLNTLLDKVKTCTEPSQKNRKIGTFNTKKELDKLLQEKDLGLPWLIFQKTFRQRYKQATGKSLNHTTLQKWYIIKRRDYTDKRE